MISNIQNKIVELMPHDKCLHFVFGFFIFALSNLFLNDVYSLGIVFLFALAKEIRDEISYGGFDVKDLIFTILPALTKLLLILCKR